MKLNLGSIVGLLPYIQMAMQKAQAIKDAKGSDKKKVAIEEFAVTAIQALEVGAGRDVINDPLVVDAVGSVMDAIKNAQNVIDDAKARHGAV